jgi:hypothetical protein
MTNRVAAAAVAALIMLSGAASSGCGDKDHKRTASGGTTTTVGDDGDGHGDDDGHHPAPTLVDPKTGKQGRIEETDKYTASSPPPASFRQPDIVANKGEVPLEVKVSPPCVEHGQKLIAVMRSEPGITVAAQVKWPNDQFSGLDSTRGTTDADGTFRWEVEVKPTALWGVADLQVAAIDESAAGSTRSGSAGNWEFVVASAGRC